ncbi:MAG: hypothetical protein U5N85_04880 [Arcicella sp.]|nr:hypothetical protein [Arcicella sp.]
METIKLSHSLDNLMDVFKVQQVKKSEHLDKLLTVSIQPLKSSYQDIFNVLLEEIQDKGDQWNEEELKMKFLAFVFFISEIEEKGKIQAFYERPLSLTKHGHKLAVKTDCMVATPLGKNTPREPYFFLQEFKKGKGDKYDPEAQMLAAMIIAEEINEDKPPIYGAFIVGKNWIFTVLHKDEYCRSRQFDASDEKTLMQIIFILRNLKVLILNR